MATSMKEHEGLPTIFYVMEELEGLKQRVKELEKQSADERFFVDLWEKYDKLTKDEDK